MLEKQLKEQDIDIHRLNREVVQQHPGLEIVENELLKKVYSYHESVITNEQEKKDLKDQETKAIKDQEEVKRKRRWELHQQKKLREAQEAVDKEKAEI